MSLWKRIFFTALTRKQLHLISLGYFLFAIILYIWSFDFFLNQTILMVMAALYTAVVILLIERREEITGGRILMEAERCLRAICRVAGDVLHRALSSRPFLLSVSLFACLYLVSGMIDTQEIQHVSASTIFVISMSLFYMKSLLLLLVVTLFIVEFFKCFFYFLVCDKLLRWLEEAENEGVHIPFSHHYGTRLLQVDSVLDSLSTCNTEKAWQLYWKIKKNARLYARMEFLPRQEKLFFTSYMLQKVKTEEG